MTEIVIQGVAAAPGIGLGHVYVIDRRYPSFTAGRKSASESPDIEVDRFNLCLEQSRSQLETIREKIVLEFGEDHGYLVEAQLLALDDSNIIEEIRTMIRNDRVSAEHAVRRIFQDFCEILGRVEDSYFKERFNDVQVVERRLMDNLSGEKKENYIALEENTILVAKSLSPVDLVKFSKSQVSGIVLEDGGKTSHLSILSRTLSIPCIVGVKLATLGIEDGARAVVDGETGELILHPSEATWADTERRRKSISRDRMTLLKNRTHPAKTKDGRRIRLFANLDFPDEVASLRFNGAEGVGMLRTETLFLSGPFPPTEDEQYERYAKMVAACSPGETVIRLFDIDPARMIGDAGRLRQFDANPALGLRGIRFLVKNEGILRGQIRSILRSAASGKVGILIPMVTSVAEVRSVTAVVREETKKLGREGKRFECNVRLGAMIEVPSAALTAETIAREVDFLSIGTNDLVQYALGVDRDNTSVSDLYDPLHPAVLGLIRTIVSAAHKSGIAAGVCGEIASERLYVPVLVGLDVDFLSMHPYAIPEIKQTLSQTSSEKAKAWVDKLACATDPKDARKLLLDWGTSRPRPSAPKFS